MKESNKSTSKTERIKTPILGIFVDSTSKARALNRAWEMGDGGCGGDGEKRSRLIVTPNPEIILASLRGKSLARILNKADLAVPDGVGVVMAMRYLGMRDMGEMGVFRPVVLLLQGLWVGLSLFFNRRWIFEVSEVVPGRWLFETLVGLAAKHGKKVFLLGGKPGVAEKAARASNIKYKQSLTLRQRRSTQILNIKYATGPWLDGEGKPKNKTEIETEKETIEEINAFKPHFLFVGVGHPKQEKWLWRNLPKLKVGVAMTVGGAFDYLAGDVPKPPQWVTVVGFEWLWRLLTQPWRARRIFTALIIFPLMLYLYRLQNKETHI